MARMVSQAGEMEVHIEDVTCEGGKLLLVGKLGVWNSKIYFSPAEIGRCMLLLLKPSVLFFLLSLPFRAMGQR